MLVAKKQPIHDEIVARDNKDQDPLKYATYSKVLDTLKIKDKRMYRHINRAGKAFQYAMFKYYKP